MNIESPHRTLSERQREIMRGRRLLPLARSESPSELLSSRRGQACFAKPRLVQRKTAESDSEVELLYECRLPTPVGRSSNRLNLHRVLRALLRVVRKSGPYRRESILAPAAICEPCMLQETKPP